MAMNCHKKVFICEIKGNLKEQNFSNDVVKAVMKSCVFGVITGIQRFSRRTIYSVDDGTGLLDCVLWHNESPLKKRMDRCLTELNSSSSGNAAVNSDLNNTCQLLLNKIQLNDEATIYSHGDKICCLGIVKIVKKRLLLDINLHYKADNVDAETMWILDVLFNHQHK